MIERIKVWYYSHKTWIYNIQYILYSIILLIFVMMIDLGYYNVRKYIPDLFFTSVSLSKTILSTLAGAQLTITTFTFSTILSVMTNYMSNFSPRTIENFVEEKITMKVLGIFFGGFFYSITALYFMRDFLDDQLVISGFVAVAYAVVSMFYFIIFIQKVIYSSKGDNLISNIYEQTLKVIEKELEDREEYHGIFSEENSESINIYPTSNGFLSAIDYTIIASLLSENKFEFIVDARIGDFVNVEKPVAHINRLEQVSIEEKIMSALGNCFVVKDSKVYQNDYRHGIDKIEEIAVRALSPGINDPTTAIHCIHKITLLLAYLSKTSNNHIVIKTNDNLKISYTSHTFEDDLYYSFNQIIHYGKEDIDVMFAVFEGLETLYYSSNKENKEKVFKISKDIYENILPKPDGEISREKLDYIYSSILSKEKYNEA